MKTALAAIFVILFFVCTSTYASDINFNQFINDYSEVRSIKGSIVQYIYSGTSIEKLTGDYTAVSEGWFRIDYTEPEKQIVIANDKGLYWFYPVRNLLFLKQKDNDDEISLSGNPLIRNFNNVNILYQGIRFYGLLKFAHVYNFKTPSGTTSVNIWFDPEKRYVVRKYIIDDTGREMMKEIYHEHFVSGKIYIPSKIELFIRSRNGVVHTRTEYSNLLINFTPDNRIFDFRIQKNMTVHDLNEKQ